MTVKKSILHHIGRCRFCSSFPISIFAVILILLEQQENVGTSALALNFSREASISSNKEVFVLKNSADEIKAGQLPDLASEADSIAYAKEVLQDILKRWEAKQAADMPKKDWCKKTSQNALEDIPKLQRELDGAHAKIEELRRSVGKCEGTDAKCQADLNLERVRTEEDVRSLEDRLKHENEFLEHLKEWCLHD